MKFDNLRLLVKNFDACLHFYQEILGFPLTWGEAGGNYASFDVGEGNVLALFKKELMSDAVGCIDLSAHGEIQDRFACIFTVTDLEETVQTIKNRGGVFVSEVANQPLWGIRRLIYVIQMRI